MTDCETWRNVITIPATCCWFRGCGWSIMNRRNTFERKKTVRESLFWNVSDTVVRSSETDERLVTPEMTLSLWHCQNKLRSKADHVLILWNRLTIPLWVWSNRRKTSVKNIQQMWKRDGNLIESEKQFLKVQQKDAYRKVAKNRSGSFLTERWEVGM